MNVKIGLEIHIRVKGKRKLFSNAANDVLGVKNVRTQLFDLGIPGSMPRMNGIYLVKAMQITLSLGSKVSRKFSFDRKHYRYPDLPLGYQISQFFSPISKHGMVKVNDDLEVGLRQIHLEMDAAKTERSGGEWTIDYNRTGVPLIEVVTEPDITCVKDMVETLIYIRKTAIMQGISDCDMSKGDMRFDINFSVDGGARQEIKNMNSFKFARQAVQWLYENRDLIDDSYTWEWVESDCYLTRSRKKANAKGYRYLPELDLPIYYPNKNLIRKLEERSAERRVKWEKVNFLLKDDYLTERVFLDGNLKRIDFAVEEQILNNSVKFLAFSGKKIDEIKWKSILSCSKRLKDRVIKEFVEGKVVTLERKYLILDRSHVMAMLREQKEVIVRYLKGETKLLNFLTGKLIENGYDPIESRSLLIELMKNDG